jgi:aspartyl-tRNA(Asn)/glutamyl-tRNA(Gln) amidotransferase subunit A
MDGALSGKSLVIQPNLAVGGWPADAGSPALINFHALEDATVVERLKQAGAHIIGAARMSELGFGLAGDLMCDALWDSRADMALMTDLMGESRITASRIGWYAFKPTVGIMSRFGCIDLVPSMTVIGVLSQDPVLIAQAMAVMAGRDEEDYAMDEAETPAFDRIQDEANAIKTIGVIQSCMDALDAEETALFENGLKLIRSAGFTVKNISLPDFDCFRMVHHCVGAVEASSSCGKYDGVRYGHRSAQAKNWNEMYIKSRAESFGSLLKSYLLQGAYFQYQNYKAFENASRIRARLSKTIYQLFTECNALAFPTRRRRFTSAADSVSAVYDAFFMTLPANVLGTPVVQMPGFASDGATDLGVQLMGPRFGDVRLLAAAVLLCQSVEGGK